MRNLRLAPWIPSLLAAWLPGSLAVHGGLARGRLETVLRDLPDSKMWFPGLAVGRPETVPREDPADPGPGTPRAFPKGEGAPARVFGPPYHYNSSDLETRNLDPGPRSTTPDPGTRDLEVPDPAQIQVPQTQVSPKVI